MSSTGDRFVPSFDPYSYTQGRWLDRDTERRTARELRFDFDALLDRAVKSSAGARRVVDCEKKEGGFNRVFIIQLDNGAKVVARLPTRLAGPSGLTLSSEVATMGYVRENTNVPVPKVLAWSDGSEKDPVGAEYMIMDAVPGVPLKDAWSQMTGLQHIESLVSLGKLAEELCALDFAAFGSLYLNTANRPTGSLPINGKYCIGPHCARQLWGHGIGKSGASSASGGSRGPWQNLSTYFSDLANIAKSTLPHDETRKGSVDEHLRLLDVNLRTLQNIEDADAIQISSKPTLFHPDFHTRNIFVAPADPTQITGIIDWQSAAIEPAFVHAAETPDFAEELPFDETLDANRDAEMDDARADAQRCAQTWAVLAYTCPKLGKALALDPLLCRYLAAAGSGWLDDAHSLRSLLTDLNRRWEDLGLPAHSLYQPSQIDLDALNAERDELQSTQRLKMYLARLLRCETDGWVEASRWEEVVPIYRAEYDRFIEACVTTREEDESESEAVKKGQRLWPFDLR